MNYNTAAIRELLKVGFDDPTFNALCFDYFLDVYNDFTSSMGRLVKIQLLHFRGQPKV